MTSKLTGRMIVVQFPQSAEKLLLLEVEIDCPSCGQHTIRLAGHHLRAIRELCTEAVDLHPDLCGEEAGLQVLKKYAFSGTPPADPETN